MRADELKIGGRYNWLNQPERLIYMGSKVYPCRRRWYQFALVSQPDVCWSEVLESDLSHFEETATQVLDVDQPAPTLKLNIETSHDEWRAAKNIIAAPITPPRRKGENRAQHRARVFASKGTAHEQQ